MAARGAKDELTDHTVYKRLAKRKGEKDTNQSQILSHLAETEFRHYEFWKKYCPEEKIGINTLTVYFVLFLRYLFGPTFAVKYLEKHEAEVIRRYKSVANLIPSDDKPRFNEMIRDEEEHENGFTVEMQQSRVSYLSFIVLGLADAIVEISGIHAGSLGIYRTTLFAGIAGVVAGAAASIAMASAAYAQAKTGFKGSPALSAFYTGISYFINAVILATPYFLTKAMVQAITSSLILAVLIIAFISYYNAVVSEESFKRDFAELTGIMFGATLALYLLGTLIRGILGVTI